MRERTICLPLLALAGFLVLLLAVPALAREEKHEFYLYSPKDRSHARGAANVRPYILTFPITVGQPGLVRVYGKVTRGRVGSKVQTGVGIRRKGETRVLLNTWLRPDRRSFQLRYAVDSDDLRKGGEFEIVLVNGSPLAPDAGTLGGELLISYPVAGEEVQRARPMAMDLAVEEISLDGAGYVQVTLVNRGQGRIAPVYWRNDGPRVMLYRGDRSWGGASLAVIDPDRNLSRPGGRAVYHSRLRPGNGRVRAVLEPGSRFPDADQDNNSAFYPPGR